VRSIDLLHSLHKYLGITLCRFSAGSLHVMRRMPRRGMCLATGSTVGPVPPPPPPVTNARIYSRPSHWSHPNSDTEPPSSPGTSTGFLRFSSPVLLLGLAAFAQSLLVSRELVERGTPMSVATKHKYKWTRPQVWFCSQV